MFFDVNWFAIIIAAILNLILGWIWYSPKLIGQFFGTKEEKAVGMKMSRNDAWRFIASFVGAFFLSWALAFLINLTDSSLAGAVILGLIVWFGFIVTTLFSGYTWGNLTLNQFISNVLFNLIYMVIISLIIGAWR